MQRVRTMAYTHAEFMRLLPRALAAYDYEVQGNVISAGDAEQSIRIHLGPEYERRLAALSMPVMDVTIDLEGLSDEQAYAFLDKFDRTYRRGGG